MCGTSLTAERQAEKGEIEAILAKKFNLNIDDVKILDNCTIWKVDKMIEWKNLDGGKVEIPYEAEYNLMPIPPLADPLDTKQEEEKPCTA